MSRNSPRFILVICRGGMDGLSLIGRPDSKRLRDLRPDLLAGSSLPATDGFAFHPALKNMHALFEAKELSFLHAAGLPFRDRSHFKSQDMLESALDIPHPSTGWLGRALAAIAPPVQAVSFGRSVPLVLRGAPDSFNWSNPQIDPGDEALLHLLKTQLYPPHAALTEAMNQVEDLRVFLTAQTPLAGRRNEDPFSIIGRLIAQNSGPDVGVISVGDWDTHDNQIKRLSKKFAALDEGIGTLKDALGAAWDHTIVLVVSEFGRSVAQNGTKGTDHGTGGAVILTGGAVAGGESLGEWPGLEDASLFQGRDLYPKNDVLQLFAQIMQSHFGLPSAIIESTIFPSTISAADRLLA